MSTNFYVEYARQAGVDFDGNEEVRYKITHIGKRSAGWRFLFAVARFDSTDDNQVQDTARSFSELIALINWLNGRIVDEYGRQYSLDGFVNMVNSIKHLKEHSHASYTDEAGNDFLTGDFC